MKNSPSPESNEDQPDPNLWVKLDPSPTDTPTSTDDLPSDQADDDEDPEGDAQGVTRFR
jgi:hypothetical protein